MCCLKGKEIRVYPFLVVRFLCLPKANEPAAKRRKKGQPDHIDPAEAGVIS